MLKKLLLICLCLALCKMACSQDSLPNRKIFLSKEKWSLGIGAGVNCSNFISTYKNGKGPTLLTGSNRYKWGPGMRLGFIVERKMTENWAARLSLFASYRTITNGGYRTFPEYSYAANEKYGLLYLELPVKAVYTVHLKNGLMIRPFFGLYFAYGLYGKCDYDIYHSDNLTEDVHGEVNVFSPQKKYYSVDGQPVNSAYTLGLRTIAFYRFDAGLSVGAGIQWRKIGLRLSYDLGFHNFAYQPIWNHSGDNKYYHGNKNFQIIFTYMFYSL